MSARLVRITATVVLHDTMDEPIPSVAAALALQGFTDGDVEVRSIAVEMIDEAS